MLEKALVGKIVAASKNLGWFPIKIHGNAYQMAGLPDVLLVKEGRAAWIEVKVPGNKTSPIQDKRIADLRKFGCPVCVAYSVQDAESFLSGAL